MLIGSMSLVISATTAEQPAADAPVYEYNTSKKAPTMDYIAGEYTDPVTKEKIKITTKEQKLEIMDLRLEQNGFRLYIDEYSGEVAVENIQTGDVMFTNPYNTGSNDNLTDEEKINFLSQIIVEYKDMTNREALGGYYTSYKDAVKGGTIDVDNPSQLSVKYIKNGLRVEYSIGRVDTRYLVPERITEEHFKEKIFNVAKEAGCSAFEERLLKNFFERKFLDDYIKHYKDEETIAAKTEQFLKEYPEAEKQPVMKFTGVTKQEYKAIEAIIKKYCPDFTYEELDTEHLSLNYTPEDKNEALFKIAIEYTIDEKGLQVRVPANGIRFDESLYCLENIEILPFMGAGQNPNAGYTLFPDGAGTLFDFQDLAARGGETYFYGSCYGDDFAFYNLASGAPHNEVVRYPVFGLKEDVVDEEGNERSRGYVAIIEEGDAMMTLYSYHTPEYNSVRMRVNPRPYDEYKLSSAISVAGDEMWTVISPRKYTGDFTVRYFMLVDEDVATGKGFYEPSYVGMAKAYRDYLIDGGVLTKLTENDVKKDIPLYIETFGAIETTEKFLSVPYDSMKPLTSFEDITKMYDELEKNGIDNVNFILTGYAKGGLNVDQIPYALNWENAVEKEMKFKELLEYAKQEGFGVFPDFDFVFAADNKLFDGMSLYSHAIKTIDGRYTSKREYSATRQSYVSYFELAMSPAYFSHFYEKLTKNYLKSNPMGISVSTLGSYLNSDFDEDEPYNREDSKQFTIDAFKYFDEHYDKVLTSGGNAYTWKYVDYITDIATDSSRHARSSATVPFLGIVLHGYIQFAGEAINMEGNIDYAMLRTIENGASLKFILSYQNTEKLKEYQTTSKYYSVRYDIWLSDLIARYNNINEALGDVQLSTIEHHEFLDGIRIPNEDEIDGDSSDALLNAINKEIEDSAAAKEQLRLTLQNVRTYLYDCEENLATVADTTDPDKKSVKALYDAAQAKLPTLNEAIADVATKKTALDAAKATYDADPTEENDKIYKSVLDSYDIALSSMVDEYRAYMAAANVAIALGDEYVEKYEFARDNMGLLETYKAYPDEIITQLKQTLNNLEATYVALKLQVTTMKAEVEANVSDIEEQYADILAVEEEPEEQVESFDKYAAAKNSIVYEIYGNGKSFVLNFNNYAVKVKVGDAYYTIGAYSYIILK